MKGVVFTEFLDFVEERHSRAVMRDTVIDAKVVSEGVYVATGTYPACEMAALVGVLSEKTGAPVAALLRLYGEHVFSRFHDSYPYLFDGVDDAFTMLAGIEDNIHAEVRKLYNDAELPSFEVLEHDQRRFRMVYRSSRRLGDFCEGLIRGCLAHFGETAEISRRDLAGENEQAIEFTIVRTP